MPHIRARNKRREHRRVALNAAPLESERTGGVQLQTAREPNGLTVLREGLAVQRNMLANERTLLAYVRTALVLVLAGLALAHFFEPRPLHMLGWTLVCLGAATLCLGGLRFLRTRRRVRLFATGRAL